MPPGHGAAKCIFSTHTRDGTWGDGTKNGQIGCLAGVCPTILRICPSLDNASPSAGHTIFKQSVVSDQTHSISGHLMEIKELLAKLCWTSSAQ